MSEVDFYAAQSGQFRGSKYPGFVGSAGGEGANYVSPSYATNVAQASGQNLSPEQVQENQKTSANVSAMTGESALKDQQITAPYSAGTKGMMKPSFVGDLASTGISSLTPGFASSVGSAVNAGQSFGSALGEGVSSVGSKLTDIASGNWGSLLGGSSGSGASAAVSSAPMSVMGSAGPMSTTSSFGSSAGSSTTSGFGGALASGGIAGVGTFLSGMLSGQDFKQAAISGAGSAIGAAIGSIGGPVGTVVGSFLGSMLGGLFGGKTKHQVAETWITPDSSGYLTNVGKIGSKHVDGGTLDSLRKYGDESVSAINKVLKENNLYLKPGAGVHFGTGKYLGASAARDAQGMWQYLLDRDFIASRTPTNVSTPVMGTQTNSLDDATPSSALKLQTIG